MKPVDSELIFDFIAKWELEAKKCGYTMSEPLAYDAEDQIKAFRHKEIIDAMISDLKDRLNLNEQL